MLIVLKIFIDLLEHTQNQIFIFPLMKVIQKQVVCFAFIILQLVSFGESKIDSLSALLKKDIPQCTKPCIADTTRLNHLNALAWQLSYNNSDTAILLSKEAQDLSEKILANTEDRQLSHIVKTALGISCY